MAKNYSILRVDKLSRNKVHELNMRCEHVKRTKYAENVDSSLSWQNRVLIGDPNADWMELFKERYNSLEYYKSRDNKKLRKDAIVGLECMTTFSHDVIAGVEFQTFAPDEFEGRFNVDKWCDKNVEWMQEHFGKENVLHAVLHLDEETPHIHWFVTPIKDGRFNAKEVVGDRNKMREMQTEYAQAMSEFGLERGLKRGSRVKYKELISFYGEIANSPQVPPLIEGESAEEYQARIKKNYESLYARIKTLESEIQSYEITRGFAHEAALENDNLQKAIAEVKDQLENQMIDDISVQGLRYALDNYPERDVIEKYKDMIKDLSDWGLREMDIEQEQLNRTESD